MQFFFFFIKPEDNQDEVAAGLGLFLGLFGAMAGGRDGGGQAQGAAGDRRRVLMQAVNGDLAGTVTCYCL